MNWEALLRNLAGILSKLSLEDFILLGIIILLALERRCDKNFMIIMLVIFFTGLPQGLLQSLLPPIAKAQDSH